MIVPQGRVKKNYPPGSLWERNPPLERGFTNPPPESWGESIVTPPFLERVNSPPVTPGFEIKTLLRREIAAFLKPGGSTGNILGEKRRSPIWGH